MTQYNSQRRQLLSPHTILVVLAAAVFAFIASGCPHDPGIHTPVPATPSAVSPTVANTPVPGVSRGEVRVGPLTRTFRMFVPDGLGPAGAPLLIALHGGLGNPDQFAATSRFDELSAKERFVVVYPAGYEATWNGGACCGRAAAQKVDDVAFLASLIADIQTKVPIDSRRVFVTGHSNGAIMAFRFACERADLVAGIVPVAGSLEMPSCSPSRPVPLLAIHGDADRNHPFDGGEGPRSVAGVAFRSMPGSLAIWTKAMGCSSGPEKRNAGALTTWEWASCRDGVPARMIVIGGADHPWPGSTGARLSSLQGEPTQVLDASREAWQFFASLGE